MNIMRSEKNPIITPKDVKPSRPDFKVACVFNCGTTRFNGEILLLMRVAEMPINNNPKTELVPMLDLKTDEIVIKEFDKADPSIDFLDARFVRTHTGQYLTSISHLRIARSKNGIDFKIDTKPAVFPESNFERFGIEDPRITQINGRYYICYSAISNITGITTLSLIHISEPTRLGMISYAVFCLKKKN